MYVEYDQFCTPCDPRHIFDVVQAAITFAPFPNHFTWFSWPQQFINSNKLQQHFTMNGIFFPPSRYSIPLYFCSMPPSLLNKELPGCAFQRLQHHKRKRQSWMKASLLIQTSSTILSLSEHSSDDDICSNHWVMSHLMLSQTSKVMMQKFSKKQRKEKGNWLPGLDMSGRRRKRLTPPSLLFHFWNPPGCKEDCVAALYLWLGDVLWALSKSRNGFYLYIYAHGKVTRETRQSESSIGLRLVQCIFSWY